MDGTIVVLLDSTRKLTVSNHASTTTSSSLKNISSITLPNPKTTSTSTSSSYTNIPSITLSDPDTTSNTRSSGSLYPTSSPITSPAVNPNSSLASSPTNPSFSNSWIGGIQKNQIVSESQISSKTSVNVDLLTSDYNTNEGKAARERRNAYKEIEKAMAGL